MSSEAIGQKIQGRNSERIEKAQNDKLKRDEMKTDKERSNVVLKRLTSELTTLEQDVRKEYRDIDKLEEVAKRQREIQEYFNECYSLMPGYNTRKLQIRINNALEGINQHREKLVPKKKFAFSRRNKKKTSAVENKQDSEVKTTEQLAAEAAVKYGNDFKIGDRTGEQVAMEREELRGREVTISNLRDCRVKLHGCPGTVYISMATNCTFEIGPVSGSVFVEGCVGCDISTGCQQLRVHKTKTTTFHVHVTSRSIIEDTTDVSFGPYNLDYPGLDEDFNQSSLDRMVNNWQKVDDFNWLAADAKSPNWKLIGQSD